MAFHFTTPGQRSLGYLVKDREFISVVKFRITEESDDWGQPHYYGDMELKGKKRRPTDYDGPLTIHSNQGYSIHLEVTRRLATGRYEFRIRRAIPQPV